MRATTPTQLFAVPTAPADPKDAVRVLGLDAGASKGARLKVWWSRRTTIQIALGVSVGLHLAVLMVRFVNPEGFDRAFQDTPLEVSLVNASSATAPDQPQAIAQVNLAGGGEAEAGRATSMLPAKSVTELGDADREAKRTIEQMEDQQRQMLAQVRQQADALPQPDAKREAGSAEE